MNESSKNGGHANESFRFVQLSDLHLSSIKQANPLRLLNKRILGYLSWLRKRRFTHQRWIVDSAINEIKKLQVEHYAITGDLTHIGLKNEFQQVAEWLQSVDQPNNITVIPGNHDLYVNEHWNRSFSMWEQYMHGDSSSKVITASNNALEKLDQLYPIVRVRKHVAFIGLSSVFAAPWFRATGLLAEQQLTRLKTLLSSHELKQYCKVLLIHHPVTPTHTPLRKSLINHTKLLDILKEYPVQLILHGHGHSTCIDSITSNNNYEIPVIGIASSSSASQIENNKAEFILFDIAKINSSWQIIKQNYTFNHESKQFIATQKQKLHSATT